MTAPLLAPETDPGLVLTALRDALQQEYAALCQGDGVAVLDSARTKQQLTERLAALAPAGCAWPAAWTDLARLCDDLNRRNGEVLRLQQSTLARAMRVLSGNEAAPCLYGARGQTHTPAAGRHITSA